MLDNVSEDGSQVQATVMKQHNDNETASIAALVKRPRGISEDNPSYPKRRCCNTTEFLELPSSTDTAPILTAKLAAIIDSVASGQSLATTTKF